MMQQVTIPAITVRYPWSWAIAEGVKQVENRGRAWHHRGRIAVHAAGALDVAAFRDARILAAEQHAQADGRIHAEGLRDPGVRVIGAIVAVADLVDCHRARHAGEGVCCAPWGDADGSRYATAWHLCLSNVIRLDQPIDCLGAQGMWWPRPSIQDQLQAVGG
ncbi:hypothetical protein [Catellatospora sp. NPDC049133]|uniref:hypothetical protein n=1 Tax=Catellatospora sp. NPDC049133 TaxID=3155499 RepID=UPI00340D3C50